MSVYNSPIKGWLLDTNVVSELRKPQCHPAVKRWIDTQLPHSLYLSSITMAEIRYGIEKTVDIDFKNDLTWWLNTILRPWFQGRILGVDEDIIVCWRHLYEQAKQRKYTFGLPDLFIAALASWHQLCIVTRNTRDFEHANIPVFNPWITNIS